MSEPTQQSKQYKDPNIKGFECKFVVHVPPPSDGGVEYHMVKEKIHKADGTFETSLRLIENFQRSFYVTRLGKQNHKEKKEREKIANLQRFRSRQCDLPRNVARALGVHTSRPVLRELSNSPYLYGSDVLSTTIIKNGYQTKNPDCITPFTVAAFDVETDLTGMLGPNGREIITLASLTMKDKAFTAVIAPFAAGYANFPELMKRCALEHMAEEFTERKIEWEIEIVRDPLEAIKAVFKRAHMWKPDFVSIWNLNFDIPKVIETINHYGGNAAEIFSDSMIPATHRFFRYDPGNVNKVTSSGKPTSLDWQERWPTVYCPAGFYFVDQGCVYARLRIAKGKDPSYALDAILEKEDVPLKLRIVKEAEVYSKRDWHVYMQQNHPVEYAVYHLADCVRLEQLDEITKDLQFAMPSQVGHSDFLTFKSQPRRTVDDLHFEMLPQGYVYGSTGSRMKTEYDDLTIDGDGWIVTLPAGQITDNGLQCIEEFPEMRTNIYVQVADLDVEGSYPNGGVCFNTGKATTVKELVSIDGVDELTRRQQGINLSGGKSNSMEFCQALFGMPAMNDMLAAYAESKQKELVAA